MTSLIPDPPENPVTRARRLRHESYKNALGIAARESPEAITAFMRGYCENDLFYLMVYGMGRKEYDNDWGFQCAMDVMAEERQEKPVLSLWFRGAGKSKWKSLAKTIQRILRNPQKTNLIVSYNKSFAEDLVNEVRQELESNKQLQALYPDILWDNPQRDAEKWTEKEFSVKRPVREKENTLEGFGLVDSQPTGKHFDHIHYDDIVVLASVESTNAMDKTTAAWQMSQNLANNTDIKATTFSYCGTRYHQADTYSHLINIGAVVPQIKPATKNGKWPGESVFLPQDKLVEQYIIKGSRVFNAQMLMDPTPSDTALFKFEYIKNNFWTPDPTNLNVYILCDPANLKPWSKRKAQQKADFTGLWCIGLGADRNYYVLDIVRDKLTKSQKVSLIFDWAEKYQPINVFWFGGAENSDVQDIQNKQRDVNFRFPITELSNYTSKDKMIPDMEGIWSSRRVFLPHKVIYTDFQGKQVDLVQQFIYDEFLTYPFCNHEDMLSAFSMVKHKDVELRFPDRNMSEKYRGRQTREDEDQGYDIQNWGLE